LLNREVPASPRIGFTPVDVRDVAIAHRLAMERPEAAGNRYICAGDYIWMQDIAKILAGEFNPQGYKVPTGRLPYWLLWGLARFDRTVRLALDLVAAGIWSLRRRPSASWVGRCDRLRSRSSTPDKA
jgi:nucleoside-diphosphate-sugar epimerase